MPRKPNYNFERQERDRVKAAKKAEREKIKAERREANKAANAPPQSEAPIEGEEDHSRSEPGADPAKP
jgi:hypothetical protein